MAVRISARRVVAVPAVGLGRIAGELPTGLVTFDNVPGRAEIDLVRRSDRAWLRREYSKGDGTYGFVGLTLGTEYDLIGRDLTGMWDDVIVGRVVPFVPLVFDGNAPGCVIGTAYLYAYTIGGGEPPYSFALAGSLPDGLSLVATGTTVQISGTATALAANETFEIEVEDARGATAAVVDTVNVYPAGAHAYWRVNISAANNHCSIAELEMAATAGGVNQCTGGVAIASDHYPSTSGYTFFPAQAFDGSFDHGTHSWAALNSGYGWIGYHFADPTVVTEVRICPRNDGAQSPRNFTIEWSDDGITWTVEATYINQTSWTFLALTAYAV